MSGDREQADGEIRSGAGRAAHRILEEIIAGNLKAGRQLHLKDLIARTGLGPTPLREGMSRLIASGLVKAIDHRGFMVADISRFDIEDFIEFRLLLEEKALRSSVAEGRDAWRDAVLAAHDDLLSFSSPPNERPGDAIMRFSNLHKAFHSSLVSACPSLRLKEHLALLYDQEIFYCHNLIDPKRRLEDLLQIHITGEHRQLMDAALTREPDKAAMLLAGHIDRVGARLLDRTERQIPQSLTP